ncbi:MAG: hypothetical protein HEQ32_00115 [Vampirovibrio sp.]
MMFKFSVKSVNSSFLGFTLAELIISMGIVGLVILPVMLTSTTVMSKGLVKSSAHYKTNTQLNNVLNEINNVFDNSSAVLAPATTLFATTAWQPAQEFELTYYNANMARAEKIAYRLETVNSKWYLNKVQYSVPSGNENVASGITKTKVSPYSNLNTTQVEIKNNGLAPSFSYCVDSTNCTNTLASLTPDYMQRVKSVKLNMAGLQVTAKDIAPTEGAFTTGNKVFNLGSKYEKESSGDLYSASFLKSVPLTQLYGVSDVTNINPLTASVQEGSQSSLVMASAGPDPQEYAYDSKITVLKGPINQTDISNPKGSPTEIGQGSGSIASTGIQIERIVADTLRGTYAFVGTKTSPASTKLYFYDANTDVIEVISDVVKPSGKLKPADFEDYPLAIDELTGRVFWVSDTKSNIVGSTAATNPFGKTLGLGNSDELFLLGWDPYQRELGRFIVDAKGASCGAGNCQITNLQYTLIPDHRTGTLWALLDNAGVGNAGKTLVLAIDTHKVVTTTETLLTDISGATGLDYINSWDQNTGIASSAGEIYLGASTSDKTALVRLKSYRNGSNVKQDLKAVVATGGAQAYGLNDAAKAQKITSLVTVNNALNKAVIMDKDGLFWVTDGPAFSSLTSRNITSYTQGDADNTTGCHRSYGDSFQPRQSISWHHNNFYYGLTDEDRLYSYCRTDNTADNGSIWVDRKGKTTVDDPTSHIGKWLPKDPSALDPLLNTSIDRKPLFASPTLYTGPEKDGADELTLFPALSLGSNPHALLSLYSLGLGSDVPQVRFSKFGFDRSQAIVDDAEKRSRFFGVEYSLGGKTFKGLIVYNSMSVVDEASNHLSDEVLDGNSVMETGPIFLGMYYLRDSGTEFPWVFPVPHYRFTFFTYFDGTNYRLDQHLGSLDSALKCSKNYFKTPYNPTLATDAFGADPFLVTSIGWRRVSHEYYPGAIFSNPTLWSKNYMAGNFAFRSSSIIDTPVVASTFMKRAKQVDISAVNDNRLEIVLNSKDTNNKTNIVRWTAGDSGIKDSPISYSGSLTLGRSELGRRIHYENPRLNMQTLKPIALAESAEDTYILNVLRAKTNYQNQFDYKNHTKTLNQYNIRAPYRGPAWPDNIIFTDTPNFTFISHFHCDSSLRQGYKNNQNSCYEVGTLPLPHEMTKDTIPTALIKNPIDMAINTSPGDTSAFILFRFYDSVLGEDKYSVYSLPNRNAETSPSTPDPIISNADIIDTTYGETKAWVASMTYSNKTGNIYLLKCDASVLDVKSNRRGVLLKAFKPGTGGTYSRDRSQDVVLPLDEASVGTALAFGPTEYLDLWWGPKARVRYDSKNGLIHLFSNVSGRERVYTYQQPAGRPF